MSANRSRIPAFARWSALPIGLVVSAALVWQASYAAFTATTTNPTNNWATGNVALSDDDTAVAMFNASTLKPGSTGSKCIVVTYNGNLAANVELYATGKTATNSLDSYIDLTVEQGTGGTYSDCTGFAVDTGVTWTGTLATLATTYATGFGTFAPTASGQKKTYKITWTVNASTPNTAQGSTASAGLTWEAQNT